MSCGSALPGAIIAASRPLPQYCSHNEGIFRKKNRMEERLRSSGLRKGRYSSAGQAYLVTAVTHERRTLFADLELARIVVRTMHHHAGLNHIEPLAYVLMPDHLHWLFMLNEPLSLSQVVASVKGYSANRIKRLMNDRDACGNGCCGSGLLAAIDKAPIWQDGFHDHAIRKEEDLRAMARYVIANPLRAGLVKNIGDYPHWDAVWL